MDSKDHLIKLSKSLKFDLKDEVKKEILNLYEDLNKKIINMQKINTDFVEPMVRIDDESISFLRDDIPGETLNKKIILNNAPNTEDGYIVIKKEV